jgi:hypothetical protein
LGFDYGEKSHVGPDSVTTQWSDTFKSGNT